VGSNKQKQIYYEVVFVIRKHEICGELLYSEFSKVLNNASQMSQFAAEKVQCVYAAVSSRLALRGAVCFELQFDEFGVADPKFSVPLKHLLETSGAGPDIGTGAIRLACRSQCSISWQAKNLWEPEGKDASNPLNKVQRALWKNHLGLIITNDPHYQGAYFASETPVTELQACETKINRAFGETGRISPQDLIRQHTVQIETLKSDFRDELVKQQQDYLVQVKRAREELQQLKVELRMEQQRSRRLHQILRGEPKA
jgi:hypothetical protein